MIDEQGDVQAAPGRRIARPSTWSRVASEPAATSWRTRAAWYVGTAIASLLIAAVVMKVWRADPDVPFQYAGDALLHQLYIKAMLDHGWYLHNGALGAPFGQDLHDFPLVDSLHLVLIKAASLAVGGGFGRATNAYYLATFPLVAVAALIAIRRLGARFGPAAAAALLFTFLPYHFFRSEGHLFLAAYFLIPPTVVLAIRLYLDPGALPGPSARRPIGISGFATCLLVGSAGAYYAFFSCYMIAIAGLGGALRRRSAAPLLAAGLAASVIVAGALANLAPKFLYDRAHGPNPVAVYRIPVESEVNGLRLTQLLLPLPGHRLAPLAEARDRWSSALPSLQGYYQFSTLGAAASLGFLVLLGRSLKGSGRSRPGVLDGLALLNVFVLILALSGGLGTVLGVVVSPWVRAYERFSVFIAFFALAALALLAGGPRMAPKWPRRAIEGAGLVGVLALGLLDQTNASFIHPYDRVKRAFDSDADFVGRLEAALPAGAMVFQLPSIGFPEVGDISRMSCYDVLRPYLHSRRLRWSHGALKGSEADRWRARVAGLPPGQLLRALAIAGFEGVNVDRRGYDDRGRAVEAEIARLSGSAPLRSRDGYNSFFSIAAYRDRLRGSMPEADWASARLDLLRPISMDWGAGFDPEEIGPFGPFHWSSGTGTLTLINHSDSPRSATFSAECVPAAGKACGLRIGSPASTERIELPATGMALDRTLLLPPGVTRLSFTCDGPAFPFPPPEARRLIFMLQNAKLRFDPPAAALARSPGGPSRR